MTTTSVRHSRTPLLVVLGAVIGGSALPSHAVSNIEGTVFVDRNRDGVLDGGETALSDWSVELIDATGAVVATATTDGAGQYRFEGLTPGPYVVRQSPRPGWNQTSPSFATETPIGEVTGEWDYNDDDSDGKVGPANWHTIAPDAGGAFQSPIDVPAAEATDLSEVLEVHYQPTTAERIFNNGHTIEAEFAEPNPNHIEIGGEEFELLQFHLHGESEHALDGVNTPLEAHFVHRHHDGGLSVLGVFLTEGAFNPEFDAVFSHMGSLLNGGDEVHPDESETIDLENLLPTDRHGVFYEGSLTTPPASGPVNWFVFTTPVEVSLSQITAYQDAAVNSDFSPNNRPLQPLNGRQFNELNHEINLEDGTVVIGDFGVAPTPEPTTLAFGIFTVGALACRMSRRPQPQTH